MTRAPHRSAAIAAVSTLIVLSGCSGDRGPRGVLTDDDVVNVLRVTDGDANGTKYLGSPVCPGLGTAELKLSLDNGSADNRRRFTLRDGDVVGSSVNGVDVRYPTARAALDAFASTLDRCTRGLPVWGTTIEDLPGLDAGTHGYRFTKSTGSGREVLERVFAARGDHIVMVSALHVGVGDPSVDVTDLLPTALRRAGELDD